jgi:hypothetical protein
MHHFLEENVCVAGGSRLSLKLRILCGLVWLALVRILMIAVLSPLCDKRAAALAVSSYGSSQWASGA